MKSLLKELQVRLDQEIEALKLVRQQKNELNEKLN